MKRGYSPGKYSNLSNLWINKHNSSVFVGIHFIIILCIIDIHTEIKYF